MVYSTLGSKGAQNETFLPALRPFEITMISEVSLLCCVVYRNRSPKDAEISHKCMPVADGLVLVSLTHSWEASLLGVFGGLDVLLFNGNISETISSVHEKALGSSGCTCRHIATTRF